MYSGGQWHEAALVVREDLRPGDLIAGPAIIAEQNATTVVEPGWAAELTALDHLVLQRRTPRRVALRRRHHGRSGAAGGVQQPVHEHRRADGPAAAEHGLFGEHQGAAGFLLRAVRRRGQPDRQRAAHAGAPGLHGREHQDRDPRQRRPHAAGRRLCAERPVPRRHASAGRDGDHAGLFDSLSRDGGGPGRGEHIGSTTAEPTFYVGSRGHHADIGGITPGSMPPFSTRIEEEGVQIDNFKLVERGVLREAEMLALLRQRRLPIAQPAAEPGRPQGADRRQRKGRAGAAQDGGAVRPGRWCRPICATCRTTPRSRCAVSSPG